MCIYVIILVLFILSSCAQYSGSQNSSLLYEKSVNISLDVSSDDYQNAKTAKTIEETRYYRIIYADSMYYCYIFSKDGEVVKSEGPLNRQPRVSIVDNLVKFTLQAGTGLGTQWGFFYDIKSDVFSQTFQCIYDQCDSKVAYGGMDKIIIRDIFDESQYYREIESFNEPFSESVEPIISVKFINDGDSVEVEYLTGENYQIVIEIFDI